MSKTIELINYKNNDNFGIICTSEKLYSEIEPELPEHLRFVWDSCYAGDFTVSPEGWNLLEFVNWCNQNGIDVLIISAIYNPKYSV